MARLKLNNLVDQATVLSRGGFIINDGKFGPYASKWPKKRGKAKTPYDRFRQKEFAIAATMASNPIDLDYICAESSVKGTHLVPRDWLMLCAMGLAYDLVLEDGTTYVPYRYVTNNPQYVLEQLTEQPGSIPYRGQDFWYGLAPGANGNVLTMVGGLPSWQAAGGGGAQGPKVTTLYRTTPQTPTAGNDHIVTWEACDIDELGIWNPSFPDRIYIPPDITRMRLTAIHSGMSTSSTSITALLIWKPDNTRLGLGEPNATLFNGGSVNGTRWNNGTGVWIPPPPVEYLRLNVWCNPNLAIPIGANTAITIEAV